MVVLAHRAGFQARGIRPGVGLGQAVAGELRHAAKIGQQALSQLACAIGIDHPCDHVVNGDVRGGRRTALRQLLEDQRRVEPGERRAAEVSGDVDAAEAERRGLAQRVRREYFLLVPLAGQRHYLAMGKGAGGVLDGALLLAELEIHRGDR